MEPFRLSLCIFTINTPTAVQSGNGERVTLLPPPSPPSFASANQSLLSPTTHCPPTHVGDGQTDPKPQGGRSKKRERAASGSGTVRRSQRAPLLGGTAVSTLSSVALVPVHTIESAAEVVAARRGRLVISESAAELPSSAGRGEKGGAPGGARRSANGNSTSRPRPRTSTGCERRVRSKAATAMLHAKGGDRDARRKEVCWWLVGWLVVFIDIERVACVSCALRTSFAGNLGGVKPTTT